MPRFARMIADAMHARGHQVEFWTAAPIACRLPVPSRLKKWLGYIDQFIFFPLQARWRLRRLPSNTLFVFSDQALGPWVPLIAKHPHVIHVHDFMALRSALGEHVQNPTNWTGRYYQSLIRRGFGKGKNFISVSENTKKDLHRFLPKTPNLSEVIYNGMNFTYRPMTQVDSKAELSTAGIDFPKTGFLLHVGGNQWYKNRYGVIEIYKAYLERTESPLPLWMIGPPPTEQMKEIVQSLDGNKDIRFITGVSNELLCAIYSSARLLIFPSLAEGFGWPIAEAMSCGCLVLTTDEAPMTEVGGSAALYIPVKQPKDAANWAKLAGERVSEILALTDDSVHELKIAGFKQAALFEADQTLDAYEHIYKQVLARGSN